jgi:uncharacterized membrane protein
VAARAAPGAPAATPAGPPAPPPRPEREPLDLETLVAGKWLNRIGIVAVLLATAFFLKYAFDNDWIGARGRVVIGLVAGAGLVIGSDWLYRRGYRYFSEGITALGGGVVFLSLYAAWGFYGLIPMGAAFAGMVLATAALALIARGRDSERLAALALAAGLATPGLLLTDGDPQATLFSYLAILIAVFLVIAWERTWRSLAPIALAGILFYAIPWYEEHYDEEKLASTLLFAGILFAEIAAYFLLRALRGAGLARLEVLLPAANAIWFGLLLHATLHEEHRWALTLAVVALGALHLAAARLVAPLDRPTTATRLVLAGLALAFVTVAIPIRLEGEWLTLAWAIEAAALVWSGFRAGIPELRVVGLLLFVPVVSLLVEQSGPVGRLLLNQRFSSFLVTGLALAACVRWAREHGEELTRGERLLFPAAGIAAVVVGVWALSVEVWYGVGRLRLDVDIERARQMGLSLLWMLLAALLIWLGWRLAAKALRYQGLALLGLTIVKVFVADLSFLENAYRIASFLVLGVLLLVVSFRYQKSLTRQRRAETPAREEVP